jgi:hypothetical protein
MEVTVVVAAAAIVMMQITLKSFAALKCPKQFKHTDNCHVEIRGETRHKRQPPKNDEPTSSPAIV